MTQFNTTNELAAAYAERYNARCNCSDDMFTTADVLKVCVYRKNPADARRALNTNTTVAQRVMVIDGFGYAIEGAA